MPRPPYRSTIITLNEEDNLRRAIESVRWAEEIIVVDAGSTDAPLALASELGAKVFQNPWQGYGQQKNYAQRQATHDWILNLDADEAVSPELAQRDSWQPWPLWKSPDGQRHAPGLPLSARGRTIWAAGSGMAAGIPIISVRLADRRHGQMERAAGA